MWLLFIPEENKNICIAGVVLDIDAGCAVASAPEHRFHGLALYCLVPDTNFTLPYVRLSQQLFTHRCTNLTRP